MIHIATFLIALFAGTANPSAVEIEQNSIKSTTEIHTPMQKKGEDDGKKEDSEGIGSGNLGGN